MSGAPPFLLSVEIVMLDILVLSTSRSKFKSANMVENHRFLVCSIITSCNIASNQMNQGWRLV